MKSLRWLVNFLAVLGLFSSLLTRAEAQSPSVLYTWPGTGNNAAWVFNFGDPGASAALANTIAGELTITENGTAGESIAISDGGNRVRETPAGPSGGTDLTGLDFLEFDLGHNGAGNINVQFYLQGGPGFSYTALGPDLVVTPGVSTYIVPLNTVPADRLLYVRTMGFNARDHLALGNVTWTMRELRSSGTPLDIRTLATFDTGTAEGGLNGAIVNFDGASVAGNSGQNQTGLSHNPAGSGSLQWTDVAGGAGGAISLGNGSAWAGNSFNNRTTDLSNYNTMLVRISATETTTNAGGTVSVAPFFQKNNFAEFAGIGSQSLTIDGQFYDLVFPYTGLTNMSVIDQIGLNLGSHANELRINVDRIEFFTPEPATATLVGMALVGFGFVRRGRRG